MGIDVRGQSLVVDNLKNVKNSARKSIIAKGARAAARVISREMKSRAPVETGLLKRSIGFKGKWNRKGFIVMRIGPRRGFRQIVMRQKNFANAGDINAPKKASMAGVMAALGTGSWEQMSNPQRYAHLIEFGTEPHSIGPHGQHPGTPPAPFMRPAFEAGRSRAIAEFTRVMKTELHNALHKNITELSAVLEGE